MTSSLVGSEMCIRDSCSCSVSWWRRQADLPPVGVHRLPEALVAQAGPVSYTHLTLPTICSV
eukprot:4001938-Prorocentrum_lima.AAC.1